MLKMELIIEHTAENEDGKSKKAENNGNNESCDNVAGVHILKAATN